MTRLPLGIGAFLGVVGTQWLLSQQFGLPLATACCKEGVGQGMFSVADKGFIGEGEQRAKRLTSRCALAPFTRAAVANEDALPGELHAQERSRRSIGASPTPSCGFLL